MENSAEVTAEQAEQEILEEFIVSDDATDYEEEEIGLEDLKRMGVKSQVGKIKSSTCPPGPFIGVHFMSIHHTHINATLVFFVVP